MRTRRVATLAAVTLAVIGAGGAAALAAAVPQRSADMTVTVRDYGPNPNGVYGICLDLPSGVSECRTYRTDRPAAIRALVGDSRFADSLTASVLVSAP